MKKFLERESQEKTLLLRLEGGDVCVLASPRNVGRLWLFPFADPSMIVTTFFASDANKQLDALHMPSHIFTRLSCWDESAATNLRGWEVSEAEVRRAGESGAYRDYHNLNYLEYAYIQLGRFHDAQHAVHITASAIPGPPDKKTAPDTPELQSRHVRGAPYTQCLTECLRIHKRDA